ncbi:MAG: alkaline phosphatase D family protein, partial [Burkholderiales bacterium]|nr:alkaline phosphatase D family protein [Burkholderiales bacterium]
AAYQAYFEHLPVSPAMAPNGPAMRIHDRYRWGRLAELWTLDGRQYRSVHACGDKGAAGGRSISTDCADLADPARTVFGAAQERWLAEGLAQSTRAWKLLAQGSQVSPAGIAVPGLARRIYSDGWDGYPLARERLLDAIAAAGGNTIVLGGDVHRHVAAQLRRRPDDARSPIIAAEFVTSSITSRGIAEPLMTAIRASNPDLLHARSDERGYTFLEVTPQAAHADFRATPYPAQPGAALYSQARFSVEAGQPGVVRD